jgi:hypothetical protein
MAELDGKAYRLCRECVRVTAECTEAYSLGLRDGGQAAYQKGRERGEAEERARHWVDKGKVNT